MEQENRQARPEANEVPMSEEDRIRILIAKCYEDVVFPENLRHGEFVIENGTRIFKVNTQIDKLTTTWLKERTVIVIFQGEARDLPMRTREDLIRAYENGWQRKKTFTRGFKRGRVHGEGPNVLSYVAKSREVAQWLVAKADDVVVIRGVEYKMLFKAWMTRAELEEQRRRDDETKFWVVALRVLLRAMFHVGGPQEIMPKLTVDTPAGKRIKFFIPLIDARIPMQHWAGLPSVGLTCIPLRLLLGIPADELDSVLVEPGVSAAFLRALNEHMPLDRNLQSEFIPEILAGKWQSTSPSQEREGTEQAEQGRIQDENAAVTTRDGAN
ncbi:hypothetical protein CBR_g45843 [Chara braunii]|uniref:Uncharacterized protein n=1 Tax=Chara braunii TaxID=69332 RepID=A0A388LZQ2_CHABU|nr:hypothetical protein CBR_g45843 [Chara braunii]|eukprot:GBG87689.1 hypothetical protein CBR_g45843 [Chara braunii]